MANVCIEKDLVTLYYDKFARKLDRPKVYLLFYDHYLCAVVGTQVFERNIRKNHGKLIFLGHTQISSLDIYLVVLKNNQDALEEKIMSKYKTFLTMHNDEARAKNKYTILDHLFPDIEFDEDLNLVKGEKE